MHVVASVPLYPPASRVGAWLATHQLLIGLVGRGHSVAVATYLDNGTPGYDLDGVRVHPGEALPQLARRADVIVHHAGDRGEATHEAIHRLIPRVCIVHGEVRDAAQVATAELVVVNSEVSAAHVAAVAPAAVVCPPPVWPADHPRLAEPGAQVAQVNLSAAKGGALFVTLASAEPQRPFLAVLGGTGRQMVPTSPNVTLEPQTANMGAVWPRCRVVLCPSATETWGMVAVEAALSGLPVIAHPTAGVREALGAGPIYADRTLVGTWRDALASLDDPGHYREVADRCYQAARRLDPLASVTRFADAVEALG